MKVVGFQAQGAQNVYVAADSDPASVDNPCVVICTLNHSSGALPVTAVLSLAVGVATEPVLQVLAMLAGTHNFAHVRVDTCICAAGMFGPRCDKGCPSGTVATLTAYGGRFYSGTEPNQPYLNNVSVLRRVQAGLMCSMQIVCSWLLTPVHPNVTGITIVFTDVSSVVSRMHG